MPSTAIDSFDQRQKKVVKRLKSAAKSSGSRLLKKTIKKEEPNKELDVKMSALSDLFFTMQRAIGDGEMKPLVALKDFMKGAIAIFK